MPEDKKEQWMNYLALSTVIFAVCATLSTFKGGGFSTKSIMSQSQASDQWALYQSKSIKSYLYQMQAEKLELDLASLPAPSQQHLSDQYRQAINDYRSKVDKYNQEKEQLQTKAKVLEANRDEAQVHAHAFGLAVIYLQISILLSSIAGLLKKKLVWILGVFCGGLGLIYFADGFLVFLT